MEQSMIKLQMDDQPAKYQYDIVKEETDMKVHDKGVNTEIYTLEELGVDVNPDIVDGRKKESNQFASNKAAAEGMMDVALLTANANQLRFLMAYNTNSKSYKFILVLIILSLVLQIMVGFGFILKRYLKSRQNKRLSRIVGEHLVAAVFLITVINIFVATFSTTD